MFGISTKSSFGIDIGTQTIKIAEISNRGNVVEVLNYSIWNNELDAVIQEKDGDNFLPTESITQVINSMFYEAQMKITEAYMAIPSYLAFSSVISMPIMSPEELITAVPLEARQHIPLPINSVQLDWMNLGKNQDETNYNILLIAIPNTVVSRYLEVSKAIGIEVKGFELDAFSLVRSIDLPNTPSCIIDMGSRTTTLIIVNSDRQIQSIQSFDFGGNQMTELIAELKAVSLLEAELMKKENGLYGADEQISSIVQSKIQSFIGDSVIRAIIQSQDMLQIEVQNIVLLGGFAKISGIQELTSFVIQNQMPDKVMNINIATPSHSIKIRGSKDDGQVNDIWRDLVLSLGIALRDYIK